LQGDLRDGGWSVRPLSPSRRGEMIVKVLVAGWFSFEHMGATAGDLMVCDMVGEWLEEAALPYDVALAPPFEGGIDWESVDPTVYSHVIFACGPFGNGEPITSLLQRFAHCRLLGLNLTLLDPVESWNPFDLLIERDSSRAVRPDLVFLSTEGRVPVVGLILSDVQLEYGERAWQKAVHETVEEFLASKEVAVVRIDTRLDVTNRGGLRTPREIESLIARMDCVVTTRLHGTVLALKNGVPAVAIDPIAGGAKISRQAEAIGWPIVLQADTLGQRGLEDAFLFCLSEEARGRARECARGAVRKLESVRDTLLAELAACEVGD
jgi:hypothetical protein